MDMDNGEEEKRNGVGEYWMFNASQETVTPLEVNMSNIHPQDEDTIGKDMSILI